MLLPIYNPQDDPSPPSELFFYENVVQPLTKDIIKMEATGIPINLDKVKEVENTLNNVLENVSEVFKNNPLIKKYLNQVNESLLKSKVGNLDSKKKTWEDFYKDFDYKNTVHRTYVVNYYLKENVVDYKNLLQDKWTLKDLKTLNTILHSRFISALIDSNYTNDYCVQTINKAMKQLAKDKADIYNKTKIEDKKQLTDKEVVSEFLPGSTKMKREFFDMLGIESETETEKGQPQWNREELEKLFHLTNNLIEDKEK